MSFAINKTWLCSAKKQGPGGSQKKTGGSGFAEGRQAGVLLRDSRAPSAPLRTPTPTTRIPSSANAEPRLPNPVFLCERRTPKSLTLHQTSFTAQPSQDLLPAIGATPHQNLKALRHFFPQLRQARQIKLRVARPPKLLRQFGASSQKTPGARNGWSPAIEPVDLGEELPPTGLGSGGLLGIGGVRRQPFGGHRSSLAKGHRFSSRQLPTSIS